MNCYHAFLKTLIWMATGVKLELAKWSEYQLVFTWLDWNQPGQLHIFFSGAIYSLYKSRRGRELSRNIREIRQESEIVNCFQLVPIGKLIISLTCRYCEYLLNMLYLVDIYISYHWWRHFRKNSTLSIEATLSGRRVWTRKGRLGEEGTTIGWWQLSAGGLHLKGKSHNVLVCI